MDEVLLRYGVARAALISALGITRQTYGYWCDHSRRPSAENAKRIERLFGIPKHLLRPDIWDAPPGFRLPPRPSAEAPDVAPSPTPEKPPDAPRRRRRVSEPDAAVV
jgi:hypothetical protein